MNKLLNLTKLVKTILEQDERARNSDDYLYMLVLYESSHIGRAISEISVTTFLANRDRWGFPSYKSVSRTRRKAQEEHPELRGTERVRKKRAEREEVFREYSRIPNVTE